MRGRRASDCSGTATRRRCDALLQRLSNLPAPRMTPRPFDGPRNETGRFSTARSQDGGWDNAGWGASAWSSRDVDAASD